MDAVVHELRHDTAIEVGYAVSAVGLVIASESQKRSLVHLGCRWCDGDDNGQDDLNALDRHARSALRWEHPHTAARASDALAFVLVPAGAFGTLTFASAHEHADDHAGADTLYVFESVATTALVNQVTKLVLARERPYAHYGGHPHGPDDDLSFFSGHTSLTFTLAAAAGTVATLRGYRFAPLVWATTAPLAALTGYLRIAADKHYLTDVLTGAVVGTATGIVLPLVLHPRSGIAGAGAATAAPPPPQMFTLGATF